MKPTAVPTTATEDLGQIDPASVGYMADSTAPNDFCAKCIFFMQPDRCAKVKGAISAHGWCQIYTDYDGDDEEVGPDGGPAKAVEQPDAEVETPDVTVAVTVTPTEAAPPSKAATFHEALDLSEATMDAGARVLKNVVLIRAGMSLNRRYYGEGVLKESVAKFEGAKAYDSHDRRARRVGEMTGWYANVRYDAGALRADRYFTATQAGRDVMSVAEDIVSGRAPASLAGLSINAVGTGKAQKMADGDAFVVESILKAESVDDVTEPAAGGTYLAAANADPLIDALLKAMTFEEWWQARADYSRRVTHELKNMRETDRVKAAKAEADHNRAALTEAAQTIAALTVERDAALSEADRVRRAFAVETSLNAVSLPAAWKDSLRAALADADPAEWSALIVREAAKATAAGFRPRVAVSGAGAQEASALPVKEAFNLLPKAGESTDDWLKRLGALPN